MTRRRSSRSTCAGEHAMVTGIQRARVRLDGKEIEDRRGFVDWFVRRPTRAGACSYAFDFLDGLSGF